MWQHIAVLGCVTRELIGWRNINRNLKRKLSKRIYTVSPHSLAIVNTLNLHQGAFNRWMWNTEESHAKASILYIFNEVKQQEILITLRNNTFLKGGTLVKMLTVISSFISDVSLLRFHLKIASRDFLQFQNEHHKRTTCQLAVASERLSASTTNTSQNFY